MLVSKATQPSITTQTIAHVAQLANIPVTPTETAQLRDAFEETLGVIENLSQLDTTKVEPTHQVTGMENVLREDVPRPEFSFTQAEALANAAKASGGYFVVPVILTKPGSES